jgi:hypothetical protein
VRRGGRFVAFSALAIVALAGLLAIPFASPAERRALLVSAGIAFVVQLFTYFISTTADPKHLMTVWGAGAAVRLLTLVVYGLVMLRPFGLPPTAALISLATFLFATTLIESRLLTV